MTNHDHAYPLLFCSHGRVTNKRYAQPSKTGNHQCLLTTKKHLSKAYLPFFHVRPVVLPVTSHQSKYPSAKSTKCQLRTVLDTWYTRLFWTRIDNHRCAYPHSRQTNDFFFRFDQFSFWSYLTNHNRLQDKTGSASSEVPWIFEVGVQGIVRS